MRQQTLAGRQRLAILVALADIPPGYGLTVAQIASSTPWPPSALYTPLYELGRCGLVEVCHDLNPMLARLVEHPDLAALAADREDA